MFMLYKLNKMANKSKKKYSLVINGITESIDATKELIKMIDDLDKRLKEFQKAKIKVQFDTSGLDNLDKKVVVGSKKSGTATNPQDKLAAQIEKEKAKYIAQQNEEYRKQSQELERIKAANKEISKENKNIADGVKDIGGEYANTLAGQRAYLADLKKQLSNLELGTDEWEKLGQEVLKVNEKVKRLEESYGVFTRSVGNYEKAALGFKESANGVKVYDNSIKGLTVRINDLTEELENVDASSDRFAELSEEIRKAKIELQQLEKASDVEGNLAENLLGVKFETEINGIKYVFDDVNQGVGLLEDKLYSLVAAGKQNTKEFKLISDQIVKMRNAVISTDAAIDRMVTSGKGLSQVFTLINGFTGVASIGQGLVQLFGGQNESLDESLQKFAGLALVMQGVQATQEQLKDKTALFTRVLDGLNNSISRGYDLLKKIPGIGKSIFGTLESVVSQANIVMNNIFSKENIFKNLQTDIYNIINELNRSFSQLNLDSSVLKNVLTLKKYKKSNQEIISLLGLDGMEDAFKEEFSKILDSDLFEQYKDKQGELSQVFQDLYDGISKINSKPIEKLMAATLNGNKAAKAVLMLVSSIKALAKSTLILAAIQLAFEAITKAVELLGDLWNWMTGDIRNIDKSFKQLEGTLNSVNEELNKTNKEIDRLEASGAISNIQKLTLQFEALQVATEKARNELLRYTQSQKNLKPLDPTEDVSNTWGFSTASEDMGEFIEKYKGLIKAVQMGEDYIGANGGNWFKEVFWFTADDAKADLKSATKAIFEDISYQINNIDFSKGEAAYKQFIDVISQEQNQIALENIDILGDNEWAKSLKARIDAYKQFAEQLYDINTQIVQNDTETQKKILQNNIEAMTDRFAKEKALLEQQKKQELDDSRGNPELEASVLKKYNTLELNLKKQQARELRDIDRQIADNNIAALKDSLNKRIKELESQKQREIDAAKDSELKVNEQIASINNKYNRLIADAKEDFYRELQDKQEAYLKSSIQLELDYANQIEDIQRQIEEKRMSNKTQDVDNQGLDVGVNLSYNVNGGIDAVRQYYNELLAEQVAYNEKKKQLDIEANRQNTYFNVEDEKKRLQEQLNGIKESYEEQNKVIDEALRDGTITVEQANEDRLKATEEYHKAVQTAEEQNADMVNEIIKEGKLKEENIIKTSEQTKQNIIAESINKQIGLYSEYADKIATEMEKSTQKNTRPSGLINFKAEKSNLENAKSEYQKLLNDIEGEYQNLQSKLDKKEISFNDFTQAKKELDGLKETTSEKLSDVLKNLDEFGMTFAQNLAGVITQYAQQFGSLFSMFDELLTAKYDKEEEELERKQEILDKELEQIEDAYDKQQEVVQKYSDNINSIEDELSSARGDRRAFLVDQLAQQREAMLQEQATEQKIEEQKIANQKKQEQLQKQQDALEKKRRNQEKRANIIQATINTATAVTNALATPPWFLGVALAATAAALGAAQIGIIASQKFADGGLLNGKSHSQGGMKIEGTNMEVEGGEYVINKASTEKNLPLIEYINSNRRTLTMSDIQSALSANSRMDISSIANTPTSSNLNTNYNIRDMVNYQPEDNSTYVVSVVDINNAMNRVTKVKALAGLS